ncbi:uncharacterized protein PFLUO_LOCUS6757 [Penicillium psychrofluorescens]|uniref:uncharacterized protein n=1 Tax=Penicillium psychrofluorescens TaxID=3158075 RepID=UPI003CCDB3D4
MASSRDAPDQRSLSGSPDRDRDRRRVRREDDHHKSSRRDSPRRRSSRSPRRDRDRPRREHKDGSTDERRHRHRSHRHRDRREHDDEERPSKRRRSPRSRSPRRSRSPPPPQPLQRRGPLPSQSDAFTATDGTSDAPPAPEMQKPNFSNTGRLAAESNTVQVQGGQGVVLKYHEPPEARKPPPKEAWRLYVFKGEDLLEMVELGERSCWLVGRERVIVDFPLDHPSCSKQHAALQFRFVENRNEFGDRIGKVKPYLIDLESANGSSVNGEPVPAGRYVEVMDKDVLRFGLSSREYVMMLPPS